VKSASLPIQCSRQHSVKLYAPSPIQFSRKHSVKLYTPYIVIYCFIKRRSLQCRSDEFLDGQHSSFWTKFVSQHRKPTRGPGELYTDVSRFAHLSCTQHSQSGGAHGRKQWRNPQAIYEWQQYASVPNRLDVIWRAILPYRGKSNPHSGFSSNKWILISMH